MNTLRRSLLTWEFWSTALIVGAMVYYHSLFPVKPLSIVLIGMVDSLIIGRSIFKYSRDLGQARKYVKWFTCERICSLAGWAWIVYAFHWLSLDPGVALWLAGAHGVVYNLSVSFGKSSGVKTQVISI